MDIKPSDTEAVVRNHLQAFLGQKGIAAIVSDYDDDARFISEGRTYHGRREISDFFEDFMASLPPPPSTAPYSEACASRATWHISPGARATRYPSVRTLSWWATARSFRRLSRCTQRRRHSGSVTAVSTVSRASAVSRCGATKLRCCNGGISLLPVCLAALLYLIGFSGKLLVPKSVDSGAFWFEERDLIAQFGDCYRSKSLGIAKQDPTQAARC